MLPREGGGVGGRGEVGLRLGLQGSLNTVSECSVVFPFKGSAVPQAHTIVGDEPQNQQHPAFHATMRLLLCLDGLWPESVQRGQATPAGLPSSHAENSEHGRTATTVPCC